MSLVSYLKAARAVITPENSWCMDSRHNNEGQRCLLGALDWALDSITYSGVDRYNADKELYKTLQEKFKTGNFPTTSMRNGGHGRFEPWGQSLHDGYSLDRPLAQFNNTTSQAEVLKLFDDTIARLEPPKKAEKTLPAPVKVRELELA